MAVIVEQAAVQVIVLVDLARNDLGRVARPGTVRVEPYRSIERYSHVMHIVSGVQGELDPRYDAFDLFAASFPAGTLVGAPKVRAMQIIDELEETEPVNGHRISLNRSTSWVDERHGASAGNALASSNVDEIPRQARKAHR